MLFSGLLTIEEECRSST